MKNLDHRSGLKSTTMQLIVLVWLTFVGLLLADFVEPEHLVTVTMGGVFGWVLRDGTTKVSEAVRDKQT